LVVLQIQYICNFYFSYRNLAGKCSIPGLE